MSNFPYTIRNYRPEDLDAFVRLLTEARPPELSGRPARPELIAECLNRPGYSPNKDLFLATASRRLVGYLDIQPEFASQRIILAGWVHPDHRRKGEGLGQNCGVRRPAADVGDDAYDSIEGQGHGIGRAEGVGHQNERPLG